MAGLRPSVRFPRRTVPSWVSDPIGLPMPRLNGLQAGDERRGNRAHARDKNSQLAFGGRDLDVVGIGQQILLKVEML